MNENDRTEPAAQDQKGRAQHGYRTEVSWDDGQGRQPYANREEGKDLAGPHDTQAGNSGASSGRNVEDLEALQRRPESETPRQN